MKCDKNLKIFAKYLSSMLGAFDLSFFFFITVNSTFDAVSLRFFVIYLSTVALFVLDESFNCSNSLS